MDAASTSRKERLEALREQRRRSARAEDNRSKPEVAGLELEPEKKEPGPEPEPEVMKISTRKTLEETPKKQIQGEAEVVSMNGSQTTRGLTVMERDLQGYIEMAAERNDEKIRELQRQRLRGD